MKNKKSIWHFTWIIGIYSILIAILLLIIEYKVKWENRDHNTYLYFYNCSGYLCSTTDVIDNYISRFTCEDNACPQIKEKKQNLVILSTKEKDYLFDYQNDKVLNDNYTKFHFTTSGDIIVKSDQNKYGVIDSEGNELVIPMYIKINDYKDGFVAYQENGKVGIADNESAFTIMPNYEEAIIISKSLYAYLEENKWYIASYDTELPVNNYVYDYVYPVDDIILTIKDHKLDIISMDMESLLLLKIDTTYGYTTEEERGSLNLYKEGNLLHFSINSGRNITNYIFDVKNKKLFN